MTLDEYIKQGSIEGKKKEIRKDLGENYTKEKFVEVLDSARKDGATFQAFVEIIKEDNRYDVLDAIADKIRKMLSNEDNRDKEYIKIEKKKDKVFLDFDKINPFRLVEIMTDIYIITLDEAAKKSKSKILMNSFIELIIDNAIEILEEYKKKNKINKMSGEFTKE